VFQLQGTRTLLIQMSGRKQQSKHTRKHEEGPQCDHLFQVQSKGTSHLGLLIDPKSDPSMSKVVQQLPCRIEALQWSKVTPKQPLKKVDTQVCE
jgi:hypothetical protein